jgi:hypothetical protein
MKFGFIILFIFLALFHITEVDSVKCPVSIPCNTNKVRASSSSITASSTSVTVRSSLGLFPLYTNRCIHTKIKDSVSILSVAHENVNDRLVGSLIKGETFIVFYRIIWDFFNVGATQLTNACTRLQEFSTNFSSTCSDIGTYSADHSSQLSTLNSNFSSLISSYCTTLESTIGTTTTETVTAQLASLIAQANEVLIQIRSIFQTESTNIISLCASTELVLNSATSPFTNSSLSITGSITSTRSINNLYATIWESYARVLRLRQSSLYSTISFWATSTTFTSAWTGTLKSRFEAAYNSVITELETLNSTIFDTSYSYSSDIYSEYNTVLTAMVVELTKYWDYVIDKVYEVWGNSATCAIRARGTYLLYISIDIPKMKACASTFNYKLLLALLDLHKVVVNLYIQTLTQVNKMFACPITDRLNPTSAVSCMDSAITQLESTVTTQMDLLDAAKTTFIQIYTNTTSLFSSCTTTEFANGQTRLNTANSTFMSCL